MWIWSTITLREGKQRSIRSSWPKLHDFTCIAKLDAFGSSESTSLTSFSLYRIRIRARCVWFCCAAHGFSL